MKFDYWIHVVSTITVFVYDMSLSTEKQRLIGIQKKEITVYSFKLTNDVWSLTTVCFDYTIKSTLRHFRSRSCQEHKSSRTAIVSGVYAVS